MSPILASLAAISASAYRAVSGAFTSFSDNFNRTTTGSLGTSSSGGLWNALKGTWFADGNAAKSNDAASTYPIANIEMSSASTTSSISTGSLVTISASGTVGSISSNTVGGATFFTATITGMSSTTGMAAGQRIVATNGTGSLFGGSPDFVEITSVVSGSSIIYRTKNGTTPTAGTVTNIQTANNDGGSGIALWITDSGNWWGVSYGRSIDTSCNCQTCNVCAGYSSSTYTVCTSEVITSWNCNSPYSFDTCTGGYSSFQNCAGWSFTTFCVAFGGPGNCVGGYGFTTTCSGGWSYYSVCNSWTTSWACSSVTPNYSCNAYGSFTSYSCSVYAFTSCNCQTCYPPYIRIFKSVSNAVSEVTRWSLAAMAAAFRVITNASTKTITIRPYKDVSMTTQIGSDLTSTQATATMETKFGIVLSPSDYVQGSTLDDFNINSN
jgi:hypothetical protein